MTVTADFDFGVPVDVLSSVDDIYDLPDEVAKRRAQNVTTLPETPKGPEFGGPGQAKAAAAAEVNDNDVSFEFEGETYFIPAMDEWDLDVFEAFENPGLVWKMPRLLLSEAHYERFKSEDDPDNPGRRRKVKRTLKDVDAWLQAALASFGTNRGE
jgi:hypothetical protein